MEVVSNIENRSVPLIGQFKMLDASLHASRINKKSYPSSREWDCHRETISRLYLGESKKLAEVMRIMQQNHGFFATEAMYKRRITQWKLNKNYKSHEKAEIVRQMDQHDDEQQEPLKIHDREVKMHRIKRHVRTMRKQQSDLSVNELSPYQSKSDSADEYPTPSSMTPTDPDEVMSHTSIEELELVPAVEYDYIPRSHSLFWNDSFTPFRLSKNEEDLLFALKDGVQMGMVNFSKLAATPVALDMRYSSTLRNLSNFHSDILDAIYSFKVRENVKARASAQKANETLILMLQQQEWPIMFKLCEIFTWSNWSQITAIRDQFFKFAYEYSKCLFGDASPFTKVFKLMSNPQVLNNIVGSAFKFMIDHLRNNKQLVSPDAVLSLQMHAISVYKRRHDYVAADSLAKTSINDSERYWGLDSEKACIAITRLARVLCKQGELNRGRVVYEAARNRRLKDGNRPPATWTDYYLLRDLAIVTGAQCRWEESERNWRLSIMVIDQISQMRTTSALDLSLEKCYGIKMLRNALFKQNKVLEAATLEHDYAALHLPLAELLAEEDQDIHNWNSKMNDRFWARYYHEFEVSMRKI